MPQSLKVLMEQPPFPQPIDYEIRGLGGTTSAFDVMPTHMQPKQGHGSAEERVIELNKENGRLQHEAIYYANLANGVLKNLFPLLQCPISSLSSFIKDWRIVSDRRWCPEPIEQPKEKHRSKDSPYSKKPRTPSAHSTAARGVNNEANLPFVHCPSYRDLPNQHQAPSNHSLNNLVVKLTRENGAMRQSIELNKNLVFVVLPYLIHEIRRRALGLRSVVKMANAIIGHANHTWRQDISSITQVSWHKQYEDLAIGGEGSRWDARERGQVFPFLPPWKEQWSGHQVFPRNQNSTSIAQLERQRRILQYEAAYYKWLINLAFLQLIPTIGYHSNELKSIIQECAASDRDARILLQEKLRNSP